MMINIINPIDSSKTFIGVKGLNLQETLDYDPAITDLLKASNMNYEPSHAVRCSGSTKRMALKSPDNKALIIFENSIKTRDDFQLTAFVNASTLSSDLLLLEALQLARSRWSRAKVLLVCNSKGEMDILLKAGWKIALIDNDHNILVRELG